jgi:hypothetical protein
MERVSRMRKIQERSRRAFWLKHLHQWHWISSALCLIGLLLFAGTGFTLNHAARIEATPEVVQKSGHLPASLRPSLVASSARSATLSAELRDWLTTTMDLHVGQAEAEWNEDEIHLDLPRPGGDAWLSIARDTGEVTYERTDRGWISYLNDLHKGRNTGAVWSWFIDLFALACLVFSLTGLFLLKMHAGQRAATWPIVTLGIVIPLVLALIFIH